MQIIEKVEGEGRENGGEGIEEGRKGREKNE